MNRINLNGSWRGECVGKFSFGASVPGCTINDLVKNGYLPSDLLAGKNADAVLAFENDDWIYTKTFSLNKSYDRAVLHFGRIDTYADVYLNGILLAHVENGNIEHRFDVSEKLAEGENTIKICFFSPIKAVEDLPKLRGAFTTERLYTRREQCTYGWDWVARFVCCGLGDAELITYEKNETIVKHAYIFTEKIESGDAKIRIEAELEGELCRPIGYEIISRSGVTVFETLCQGESLQGFCATIRDAELWYPRGYGKQPLYTLRIKDGERILHEERFGIRTVEIVQLPDEVGSESYQKCLRIQNPDYDFNKSFSSFTLVVNGIKIMCKGANWVPCQPYRMEGKEEKITEVLTLGIEMGLNMLRVWGGAAFECEHFYDECSRLGILVTQDFLMACGRYPEKEEWFLSHLRKEAEYACCLLRNKPCLVWYSGDNENAVNGSFEMEDYRGKTAYEKGLKPIVEALDRSRVLLASSPYGGTNFASNTVGTTHNTQFLGRLFPYMEHSEHLPDYKEELKKYRARFIAEEPCFGATSLSSLRKFMTDDEIFGESTDMWLYHSRGNPALKRESMDYMLDFCRGVLGSFKDPSDRYFKFKYFQYEWMRVVMEQARREKWFCSGMVFWMFNDCWTASAGWSIIDYYNKPKLAFYSFKRCAKPMLCSLDYEGGKYYLHISNDALADCGATVEISKIKNGETRSIGKLQLVCPANETAKRELDVTLSEGELLVADLCSDLGFDRAFYKHGDLSIAPIEDALDLYIENGEIVLTARDYIHATELEGEAVFSDNGFSMKKGEIRRIGVRYLKNASNTSITAQAYTLA